MENYRSKLLRRLRDRYKASIVGDGDEHIPLEQQIRPEDKMLAMRKGAVDSHKKALGHHTSMDTRLSKAYDDPVERAKDNMHRAIKKVKSNIRRSRTNDSRW